MGRTPKEDYVPLMTAAARRRLEAGEEVRIADVAGELGVSSSLVNFYFGDRQSLVDAAWREILLAHVDDDQDDVVGATEAHDWDALRAIVERVFTPERHTLRQTHVRASVEARRNERLAELVDDVHDATIRGWADLVRAANQVGVTATALDPEALARLIVGLPMGITVTSPDIDAEQHARIAEAWFTMLRAVLDPAFEAPRPEPT